MIFLMYLLNVKLRLVFWTLKIYDILTGEIKRLKIYDILTGEIKRLSWGLIALQVCYPGILVYLISLAAVL